MITEITNAKIYIDSEFVQKNIYIKDGKISFDEQFADETINADEKLVIPGFIDIHIHGAMGYDFNDGTYEAIDGITKFTASHGTTSLLATTSTIGKETAKKAFSAIADKMRIGTVGSAIAGLHMEGPFFNPNALGAQNPEFVLKPTLENLKDMLGDKFSILKLVALAPEVEGAMGLIKELAEMGIRTAIGHTTADYATATEAINSGCNIMTHFYNAMTPLKHRDPGVVGAAFDSKKARIQLICDLIHVHEAAIRIACDVIGDENVIMISDAISGMGLGDGKYALGGLDVFIKDGIARIAAGNLAGSTLTLDTALKNMVKIGFKPETAIKYLTENPAREIGIDNQKGKLREGYDADIVIMDNDFSVNMTFVEGKLVYKK